MNSDNTKGGYVDCGECPRISTGCRGHCAKSATLQQAKGEREEHQPWVPFLSDRADGVKGHYAIGRKHTSGYYEFWNLRAHKWTSCSDEVLTLAQAQELLQKLVVPTGPYAASRLAGQGEQPAPAAELCFCDRTGLGAPGVSCGDCPTRDYKRLNAPASPAGDALTTQAPKWTKRQRSIVGFALTQFAQEARSRADAVGQDKDGQRFAVGAVEAYLHDATDAEGILRELRAIPQQENKA